MCIKRRINISTWNPNLISSTQEMFRGTILLEDVDMSLMNITDSTTLTDMFKNSKENAIVKVKNQEVKEILDNSIEENINFIIK